MDCEECLPKRAVEILDEAFDVPDDYPWLFDVDDWETKMRSKPRKSPVLDKEKIRKLKGVTFVQWCLNNRTEFYHGPNKDPTIIYILGTDHEHKYSAKSITQIFNQVKPDILAMEDCLDHTVQKNHDKMMNIIRKYKGNIEEMLKKEPKNKLKSAMLFPGDDEHDAYGELMLSWGHCNNIDSIIPYYLAEKHNVRVKELDVCDFVFDKKLESESVNLFRIEALKQYYNFDCDDTDPLIDVDVFSDLLEAAQDELFVDWLELNKQLELFYNPRPYILETHIRDVFMAGRLQDICLGNPGKTILCLVGADHMFGTLEYIHHRIPKSLMHIISNTQKSRKQLWKKLKNYDCNPTSKINKNKLQIIGVKTN